MNYEHDEYVRASIMADSWASVLEKTDHILTRRDVRVMVERVGPASPIAWSDGVNIVINASRVEPGATVMDSIIMKGVNYHELCHVKFTPRMQDEVVKMVKAESLWKAFNLLEDARIENLFVATYRPAAKFFTAVVSKFLTDPTKVGKGTYLLTYGRKYLPPELRVTSRSLWADDPSRLAEAERVLDQYLLVDPISEAMKAIVLIRQMHNIMQSISMPEMDLYGQDVTPQKSRGLTGRAQQRERNVPVEVGAKRGSVRKSEFDKAKAGVKKAVAEAAKEDRKVEEPKAGTSDAVQEAAKEVFDQTVNDPAMQQEAKDTAKSVQATSKMAGTGRGAEAVTMGTTEVGSEYQAAARRIKQQIMRIRAEVEPETHHRQYQGRLDFRRVLRADPQDRDLFKVWDEGHEDELEMEAVLLCDRSGSMKNITEETSATLWTLAYGLQSAGVRVTVLAYDTAHRVLYGPNQHVSPGMMTVLNMDGGTNPDSGIAASEVILAKSGRPNKVFICVTDGSWSGNPSARDAALKRMKRSGVVDRLFLLDSTEAHAEENTRSFSKAIAINTPRELIKAVADMTLAMQRRSLQAL